MLRNLCGGIAIYAMLIGRAWAADAPLSVTNDDWLTFGYDQQRSGWNQGEKTLTKQSVGRLKLLWTTQLDVQPLDVALSTLTSPLAVSGVDTPQGQKNLLFVVGINDTIYAIDADNGKVVWQKVFSNLGKPVRAANTNCSNTEQATPVIDKEKRLIYFTMSDGKLRGLDLATGEERLSATQFVAPFSRNWSLNLVDNVVYTAAGRGCGGEPQQKIEWGDVSAMDISDPLHPVLSRTYTGHGRPAGPWGRGGPVLGPKGVIVQTADGNYDPASGVFGNSVLEITPKAYGVIDSFTPANWKNLNAKDLDLGSGSPVIFPFQGQVLVATSSKEGVVYVLDANNLGGSTPDHSKPVYQTPRLGNEQERYYGRGVWGGISTYVDADGFRHLYVPMWGPPASNGPQFPVTYGAAPDGSIMAFRVSDSGQGVTLVPEWESSNMLVPDNIAVANDVVFAVQTGEQTVQHPDNPEGHGRATNGQAALTLDQLSKFRSTPTTNMVLYALDAHTGKQLYSSGKLLANWVHFNQPTVAFGRVFLVSHDAHVYAFGVSRR
jgi:outer membrane protein assembly factor BamB